MLDGTPDAQTGDVTAAVLFHEHAAFAWRLLRRLGVADADTDDVCQEVFLTVHRRLPDFEGRSSTRTLGLRDLHPGRRRLSQADTSSP